jgi:hypothetical protein
VQAPPDAGVASSRDVRPARRDASGAKAHPARAPGATPPSAATPERSELPLTLVGTLVVAEPAASRATIRMNATGWSQVLRPGDQIVPGVALVGVEERRAYVRNGARLEILPLVSGAGAESAAPASRPTENREGPVDELYEHAPVRARTLDAGAVRRALEDRHALERQLERSELYLDDGYEDERSPRVAGVAPGGLYDRMGLRAGDVLLAVNGELVLNGGDALFKALQTGSRVTARVLRRGLPLTIQYEIR